MLIKPTSPFIDDKYLNEILKYLKKDISMKIFEEGEKYLITIFYLISYEDQTIFHMIYLLSSIFTYYLFPTIQQTAFNYFQQMFSSIKLDNQILFKTKSNNQQIPPTPTGIFNILFR